MRARRPMVFFIVGRQKSYSTWVQILANAHPNVACRSEGHYGDVLASVIMEALQRYNQQGAATFKFGNPHMMSATRLLIDQHLAKIIADYVEF